MSFQYSVSTICFTLPYLDLNLHPWRDTPAPLCLRSFQDLGGDDLANHMMIATCVVCIVEVSLPKQSFCSHA